MSIESIKTPRQAAIAANAFEERFPSLKNDFWFDITDFVEYFHENWENKGVPKRICVCAYDQNNEIIGFGVAQECSYSGEGLWNIPIFGVIDQHIRQGFGKAIVQKLVDKAYRVGARSFLLDTNLVDEKVSGGKSPRIFWEKMGFKFIGSHDGYLTGDSNDGVGGWFILDTNSLSILLSGNNI